MSEFKGFPRELINFFQELSRNNTKKWFDANRQHYDEVVKAPSVEFILSMGERLKTIAPNVHAVPKVQQITGDLACEGYEIGGVHYKRVPNGYPSDHPYADLLKHNGLYTAFHLPVDDRFFSPDIVDVAFAHYKRMLPLHEWLRDVLLQ